MHDELFVVIRAFQAEVAEGVALLARHLGTASTSEQRDLVRKRAGFLDEARTRRCAFHGKGCRLQLGRRRFIDWDYGYEGRTDGFDLWRLEIFLRSRRKLQRVLALERLKEAFEEARGAGVIRAPWLDRHDGLHYVARDLDAAGDGQPTVAADGSCEQPCVGRS